MRTLPAMTILMLLAQPVAAQPLCDDVEAFSADGWQLDPVQDAMDKYLRDH